MAWFKKKTDLIAQRSRELTARIAELEARIKRLNQTTQPADPRRLRSTVYPPGAPGAARPRAEAANNEPVFEPVDRKPLKDSPEPPGTARHYNDLGARKFDLISVLERIKRPFARSARGQSQAGQLPGRREHPGLASIALREAGGPQPFPRPVPPFCGRALRPVLLAGPPPLVPADPF